MARAQFISGPFWQDESDKREIVNLIENKFVLISARRGAACSSSACFSVVCRSAKVMCLAVPLRAACRAELSLDPCPLWPHTQRMFLGGFSDSSTNRKDSHLAPSKWHYELLNRNRVAIPLTLTRFLYSCPQYYLTPLGLIFGAF